MKRILPLSAWLLLALCAVAGPPPDLPSEVQGEPGAFVKVAAKTDGKQVRWVALDPGLNVFPVELLKDSRTAVVTAQQPGRYRLLAYTAVGDDPSDPAICTVVIGTPGPPVPPVPPVPPGPVPMPAPIAGDGLHVLIVYDVNKETSLPAPQRAVLTDGPLRAFLNQKCPVGSTQGQHEWWIVPEGTDFSALPKKWQDAMARPRKSLPWIVVSNPQGGGGFEGPLPADADATLNLIKQYAEPKKVSKP